MNPLSSPPLALPFRSVSSHCAPPILSRRPHDDTCPDERRDERRGAESESCRHSRSRLRSALGEPHIRHVNEERGSSLSRRSAGGPPPGSAPGLVAPAVVDLRRNDWTQRAQRGRNGLRRQAVVTARNAHSAVHSAIHSAIILRPGHAPPSRIRIERNHLTLRLSGLRLALLQSPHGTTTLPRIHHES